jgi:hypothetical protein
VVFTVSGLPSGTVQISYHWHVAGAVTAGTTVVGGSRYVEARNGRNQDSFTVQIPQGRKTLAGPVVIDWTSPDRSGSASTGRMSITCTN